MTRISRVSGHVDLGAFFIDNAWSIRWTMQRDPWRRGTVRVPVASGPASPTPTGRDVRVTNG